MTGLDQEQRLRWFAARSITNSILGQAAFVYAYMNEEYGDPRQQHLRSTLAHMRELCADAMEKLDKIAQQSAGGEDSDDREGI